MRTGKPRDETGNHSVLLPRDQHARVAQVPKGHSDFWPVGSLPGDEAIGNELLHRQEGECSARFGKDSQPLAPFVDTEFASGSAVNV